ncbi:unnamed protein product [Cyclocybe aegerita]|uniref:Uncharacterized protein n=1 Tax=Cyclocybe aegerita TaxID=1973307 RepID=A0A8S0WUF7_CYCAE|nr:unnamed protein product [Cyclocybe aegerita]
MVNGPPTPPPTTAAELQDEARTASTSTADQALVAHASDPPPPQAAPETRLEIYQSVLPALIDSIARNEYNRLTASDRQQSRFLVVAPLVLGQLILDDLYPARYALQRLPDNLTSHPLARALMALAVLTINREHAKVYDGAAALVNLVSQPDFMDRDLASIISQLLSAFLGNVIHQKVLKWS